MARIQKLKSTEGMPIERLKPGDDPTEAINRLYSYGRRTYGQPMPDAPRETTPKYKAPTPSRDERADYALGKNSPVTPAPAESDPQFRDDKTASHDDASGWVRGMGNQSPHQSTVKGVAVPEKKKLDPWGDVRPAPPAAAKNKQ
jgi:hypothetical protein